MYTQQKMCILLFGGGVFCISARSSWCIVLFKSSISLLVICLVVVFIIESGLLKCPAIIVELPISPFNSVKLCICL